MKTKRVKMAMPTQTAGIVGLSADERLGNIEIDPKTFLIGVVILLILAKLSHIFIA